MELRWRNHYESHVPLLLCKAGSITPEDNQHPFITRLKAVWSGSSVDLMYALYLVLIKQWLPDSYIAYLNDTSWNKCASLLFYDCDTAVCLLTGCMSKFRLCVHNFCSCCGFCELFAIVHHGKTKHSISITMARGLCVQNARLDQEFALHLFLSSQILVKLEEICCSKCSDCKASQQSATASRFVECIPPLSNASFNQHAKNGSGTIQQT